MSLKIFCDLDGVVINFVLSAMSRHRASLPGEAWYPANCKWDILKATNYIRESKGLREMSAKAFWDSFDYKFWRNLKAYPGAKGFVNELRTYGEVFFATSPTLSGACVAGKYEWVMEHFPELRKNTLIGARKDVLAGEGCILIDDRDKNCNEFIDAGGQAILVPRPWNNLGYSCRPYHETLGVLEDICNS